MQARLILDLRINHYNCFRVEVSKCADCLILLNKALVSEEKRLIPPVLDRSFKLESEQPLFKLAMMSNAGAAMEVSPGSEPCTALNPITKLWRNLDHNPALVKSFGEYVKLAHIAMVLVLGSVEDERTFSLVTFLKNKIRNRLDQNLGVVVGMHIQQVLTLKSLPYEDCFIQWNNSSDTRNRYAAQRWPVRSPDVVSLVVEVIFW